MIMYVVKKSFFDMWDNLYRIIFINLGFMAIFAGYISLGFIFGGNPVAFNIVCLTGILIINIYAGATSYFVADIADNKDPKFFEFFSYLKKTLIPSVVFTIVTFLILMLILTFFSVYFSLKNVQGMILATILFWIFISLVFSLAFFYHVNARFNNNLLITFKKCFLIFFDNPGFSIGLGIGTVIILMLSTIVGFIFPGFAGVLLWWNVGLKLRLYKYDYLEENPSAGKNIPWARLMIPDMEKVGKRTLKGLIFPWKE